MELGLLGLTVDECPKIFEAYGRFGRARRYIRRLCLGKTYLEQDYKFTPSLLSINNGYVAGGCFIGDDYIKTSAESIRSSIHFSGTDSDYIRHMSKLISDTNSVSIHVRLGDYLNNNKLYGGICTYDYYMNAINTMKTICPNATFFIFSNDVTAATQLLKIDNAIPVTENTGDNSYLDMYLMSKCKNNIIANSTFSWWGAWLNANRNKKVICPTTLLNGYDNGMVFSKDWIRVPS